MGRENKRLMRLMKKHHLDSQQVAELCRVSKVTVEHWRTSEEGIGYRNMPPGLLELLEIKLGEK